MVLFRGVKIEARIQLEGAFKRLPALLRPLADAVRERQELQRAQLLLRARLLVVRGTWQRDVASGGLVCHLVATRLVDLTPLLGRLAQQGSRSRDFH